ncbi:uncharacterized protein PV09_08238 [Verruconis gallopava]|uniref:Coatomer subunit epsilon n=1 Tax=Verruconis gallopava TaxID=253628 RepID=A0A0D2A0L9_9PEZI|nr:uncharacterized protein PV09_08238 [Verruconis gallopava]KIW00198.1 hypothetical protein PV09_08238 [Verruconis gallopava]
MDPYSAEGELVNIHNAYHQGQYQHVVDFDTSSFSPENEAPAQLLKLRALVALGRYDDVLATAAAAKGAANKSPDLAAAALLAGYLKGDESAVEKAKALAEKEADALGVQILIGTLLARAGLVEEALALLAKHQGSLDAVALIVQIHLQQNRLDLAKKEAANARKWAQDSLLVNIAESWVGMREGGEKYQAAYYVFEELAQSSATQSVQSLVSQAVAELHLGRLEEAEAALKQAQQLDPHDSEVLANLLVLNTIQGKPYDEAKKSLEEAKKDHQLLVDFKAREEEFAKAMEKYSPKFEP